jgi:hypothetical protein
LLRPPASEGGGRDERAQGVQTGAIDGREKAAQRGAVRQRLALEQRHEGRREGAQALVVGLQGQFPAQGVAHEHGHEVDGLIATEASPHEADRLIERSQQAVRTQVPRDEDRFSEPGRDGGLGLLGRLHIETGMRYIETGMRSGAHRETSAGNEGTPHSLI